MNKKCFNCICELCLIYWIILLDLNVDIQFVQIFILPKQMCNKYFPCKHYVSKDFSVWYSRINVLEKNIWEKIIWMLDCAPLIIVSGVCLAIQAPVAQWLRHWSRKPEIPGSIPGWAHFSFSLHYLPTAKQLKSIIYLYNSCRICLFSP